MSRVIVIASQKGGVGKSTLAICLAEEAAERGKSVLLIDADPQRTATTWYAVRARQGHVRDPELLYLEARDDLSRGVPARDFDLVLVDCPPRHGMVQAAALLQADVALLPCGPTAADAWALASTLDLIQQAQHTRPLEARIVLVRKKPRSGDAARQALGASNVPVLRCEIGDRVAYQDTLAAGQGVTAYAPRSAAASEIRALFGALTRVRRPHGKG